MKGSHAKFHENLPASSKVIMGDGWTHKYEDSITSSFIK